jgi:hypothetical protein
MKSTFLLLLLFIAGLSADTLAQTAPAGSPEPTPTPRPAVKRRTFDQFDLSNGVTVGTSGSRATGYRAAQSTVVEFVDERTYEGVRQLVKHIEKVGANYKSAVIGPNYKPNDWETLSTLNRELNAIQRILALFHDGLLDQQPLKNPMNVMLLELSQTTLQEAGNVGAIWGGWSKDATILAKMVAKYNAEETVGIENMRRAALIAMLAQLKTNFTQLLSQIAVKKP